MAGQDAVVSMEAAPTSLAPGFRFHPTDEELVVYYLRRKACGKPFRFQTVTETDVYKSEPWELADFSSLKTRDIEWYFFSPVDKKYGNGSRLNRTTGTGYWKATGKERTVKHKTETIGMKKTFVFHSGRAPDGVRTNWVMHEYRLCGAELQHAGAMQNAFVLCRIYQKSGLGPPNGDRYGPFVDEEWDNINDDATPLIDAEDDVANGGEEACVTCTLFEEDITPLSIAPPRVENPIVSQGPERAKPKLSLPAPKRSKHDDPNPCKPNGSQDSTTTQDHPPQTKIMTKINFSSCLVESPLLEPVETYNNSNNNRVNSLPFHSSNLEKSVPPGYLKFISNLESEVLSVSMERETLKIEAMHTQAMINLLQSRIGVLLAENEDLRSRA